MKWIQGTSALLGLVLAVGLLFLGATPAQAADGDPYVNAARITGDNLDPDYTNNGSSASGVEALTIPVYGNATYIYADNFDADAPDNLDAVGLVEQQANSSVTMSKTLNTPEPVRPGEVMSFTISITNNGDTTLAVVPLSDTYDPDYLTYLNATPTPSDDEATERNGTILWTDLTAAPGSDLAPNGVINVTVWFTARRDTGLLSNDATTNTAIVAGARDGNGNTAPTESASDTVQVLAPTAAYVSSRSAVRSGAVVTLRWTTSDESAVTAFRLYRTNSDGTEVQLTPDGIAATNAGQPQGSDYSFVDSDLAGQSTVHYDLELIAADGSVTRLDLGRVYAGATTYLPLVTR